MTDEHSRRHVLTALRCPCRRRQQHAPTGWTRRCWMCSQTMASAVAAGPTLPSPNSRARGAFAFVIDEHMFTKCEARALLPLPLMGFCLGCLLRA